MSKRKSFRDVLKRYDKQFFRSTGLTLTSLLKFGAILVIAVVGIGWTTLNKNAEQSGVTSGIEGVESKRLTSQEQFVEVSKLPNNFGNKLPVEKISILKSKIEVGEALARSGGNYAERATDQLVSLYGDLCQLQDSEGIDSQKAYGSLSELRQQALAAGNEARVAAADFLRAFSATRRLFQYSERADFRFATDAVLSLNSKKLVKIQRTNELYAYAIELHDTSSKQDSTEIFLSILADKLIGSPESAISDLGLRMKDYPKYSRFYAAIDKPPYKTRESKLEFFDEMFSEIEKAPPQAPFTYRVIVQLLDRLVNKSDLQTASLLTRRLSKAASMISPKIKANLDLSVENIETRIATIGKTIDLSGATFDGSPLQMPNGRRTTLLFWRPTNSESVNHIRLLSESEFFDPWESNVLVASPSPLSEEQLAFAGEQMLQFKVLDNATSHRLAIEFGIDLVPYQVSLDKDGKVIGLGGAKN